MWPSWVFGFFAACQSAPPIKTTTPKGESSGEQNMITSCLFVFRVRLLKNPVISYAQTHFNAWSVDAIDSVLIAIYFELARAGS